MEGRAVVSVGRVGRVAVSDGRTAVDLGGEGAFGGGPKVEVTEGARGWCCGELNERFAMVDESESEGAAA